MVASGQLVATKSEGRLVVSPGSLMRTQALSRPLTSANAVALATLAEGGAVDGLPAQIRYRLRKKLTRLQRQEATELNVRSWLARRAQRITRWAAEPDEVHHDMRVLPSGVCDPRSGISATGFSEGYVAAQDVENVCLDYGIIPPVEAMAPTVVFHVAPTIPPTLPLLFLVADLADYGPGRETTQARFLLDQWRKQQ
jgi:hypothetical protein